MAPHQTYSRKLYIIDKEFQFGYLLAWLMLVLTMVGGLVLATLAMFFLFHGSLFPYSIEINSGLAVIFTGLSLYYMVRHSHRIAGPAYRLEYVLRQMAQGKYDLNKKVYLRKKDYLKHVAGALNELIEVRAEEARHVQTMLAGMSELDSAIQSTSGLSPEVKELSQMMFAEVVDLADGQTGVTGSTQPVIAANGKVGVSETGDMGTAADDSDEEMESVLVDDGASVKDLQRAIRSRR
jgi:hypothetical protein